MNISSAILRTPRLISPARLIPRPTLLSRRHFTMDSLQSPLFTQQVVKAMQTL
jgi:hypothetical protein